VYALVRFSSVSILEIADANTYTYMKKGDLSINIQKKYVLILNPIVKRMLGVVNGALTNFGGQSEYVCLLLFSTFLVV
jgi:hypothetical protein